MSTRIQSNEILETVKMVADQNFDVRTITIGIDLHDCISPDIEVLNQNIYSAFRTTPPPNFPPPPAPTAM